MTALNVLGGPLQACPFDPLTGFFRDGCCQIDEQDHGTDGVCAPATGTFLAFSLSCGNDLITPRRQYWFAELKPGDRCCWCALR